MHHPNERKPAGRCCGNLTGNNDSGDVRGNLEFFLAVSKEGIGFVPKFQFWFPKGFGFLTISLMISLMVSLMVSRRVTHPPVTKAATAERPEPPDVEHAGRVPVRVSRQGMGKWQVGG